MNLETDFFTLFDAPAQYAIDLSALTASYRALQKQFHPDRYANSSDQEQRMALQFAAYINEGLETLRSPIKRAIYLLGLAEVEFKADNLGGDPVFLMQQIEWREELAEISESTNAAANLEKFIAGAQCEQVKYEEQFAEVLTEKNYESAMPLISKMQFISKLLHQAELVEDELYLAN